MNRDRCPAVELSRCIRIDSAKSKLAFDAGKRRSVAADHDSYRR